VIKLFTKFPEVHLSFLEAELTDSPISNVQFHT